MCVCRVQSVLGDGERTSLWALGVVHENELRMAAFCQTVSPPGPPCVGVL